MNSGKVDVFRECSCIRAKWLYSGKRISIRGNLLNSGKIVQFEGRGCTRAK